MSNTHITQAQIMTKLPTGGFPALPEPRGCGCTDHRTPLQTQDAPTNRCTPGVARHERLGQFRFPAPAEKECNGEWALPFGGSVVYSADGLRVDASPTDWQALQSKLSASDRAALLRVAIPGTGAAQTITTPNLPVGERCLILGFAVRVSYGTNNPQPGFTARMTYTDDYGAARTTADVLLFPRDNCFEVFLMMNYLTGKRLVPCLGELIGAVQQQTASIVLDNVPTTANIEVLAVTSSLLASFRGQF